MSLASIPRLDRSHPDPSGLYLATVTALRGLGDDAAAAFAEATADGGERFASVSGLARGDLTERNVGLILAGIPGGLLEEAEDSLPAGLVDAGGPNPLRRFEAERRRRASTRRQAIIKRLARRRGFMEDGQLFLDGDAPHSLVGHPRHLPAEELGEALRVARLWGLDVQVHGGSWAHPGRAMTVWLYRPTPLRPGPDYRPTIHDRRTATGGQAS